MNRPLASLVLTALLPLSSLAQDADAPKKKTAPPSRATKTDPVPPDVKGEPAKAAPPAKTPAAKEEADADEAASKAGSPAERWSGLTLRGIGPAVTSGRIVDIAVDPTDKKRWFLAVASGGVWKTENGGIAFTPVFDGEGSYSIGCVTIDPRNPHVVWVGTGENNAQRSVGYGDGVYRSEDGGKSWKNVGLKASEHIGKILVHPKDSNVVYVAAQGPLWSKGGDRGLYKTTDGGKTWKAVLTVSENTGVSDVVMDPRDPNVLLAAAWQRRRHVFTLVDGGPESTIYKTTDGGESWRKVASGLPKEDMGRIGLAIAPTDPDTVYALVEASAAGKAGGTYRSTNRGESWEKRSDYVPGGPMYYQEILVDPKDPERLYSMDVFLKVSDDAGKTWRNLGERYKHVDNHAIWIDPEDTDHYLVGCDGGLYESFDRAATWRFFPNLPVTQFYRVDVDDSKPVYYVYGGTQDNNTLGGPSRTLNAHGAANSDWFVTWGGDGFHARIDPTDPNIVYSTLQYGVLGRYDRKKRRGRPHPAAGGARRRPAALELGQPARPQPALADAALLRRAARLPQRGPRRQLDGDQRRPDPPHRPEQAGGDGPRVGTRRGGQERVDVVLRQHRLARRVAARRGPRLRGHRRRPRAGHRGRREDVAPPGPLPGRAGHDLRVGPLRVAVRSRRGLRGVQQPQERRLQAVPPAQRRPGADVGERHRRPAGARVGVDRGRGHRRRATSCSSGRSSASSSRVTAERRGCSSRAACRRSGSATSRSRGAKATSSSPRSAAASTSSTTSRRCVSRARPTSTARRSRSP